MTGFSIGAFVSVFFNLIVGLVFSGVLLLFVGLSAAAAVNYTLGTNLLGINDDMPTEWPSLGSIAGGIVAFIVWLAFFAYLGPHSLIRFKRRVLSRLYVIAGRPLSSVEGKGTLDPSSESGYIGLEVGEFYFNFDDCWLVVADEDLAELDRAKGTMRVWYIPTTTPPWKNHTGKLVKYDCLLVRADWKPLS